MGKRVQHIIFGAAISALLILGVAATLPTPVWHGSFIGDISQATNAIWAQPASANLSNAASGSVSGYLSSSDWSVFSGKQAALGFTPLTAVQTTNAAQSVTNGLQGALGFTPLTPAQTTNAATGEALKATNGLGSAAFQSSGTFQSALGFTPLTPAQTTNAATGEALKATNGLGSAAFQSSGTFQSALGFTPLTAVQTTNAAQSVTNGLQGALGFTPLTPSQSTNAGTGEALKATNGLASSAFGNASGLGSGTVADGRLSGNVPLDNAANAFTGANTFGVLSRMDSLTVTNGITNSALTASRVVLTDANKGQASAAASGAVPMDADGSATTGGQVTNLLTGAAALNGAQIVGTVATATSALHVTENSTVPLMSGGAYNAAGYTNSFTLTNALYAYQYFNASNSVTITNLVVNGAVGTLVVRNTNASTAITVWFTGAGGLSGTVSAKANTNGIATAAGKSATFSWIAVSGVVTNWSNTVTQ